jgi:hypothetical protein
MAYSQDLVDIMRADLGVHPNLTEKEMFGALCFLLQGNLLCGVREEFAMYRPGRAREAEALAVGAMLAAFPDPPMDGLIELDPGASIDPGTRQMLTEMSMDYVSGLPEQEIT